MQIRVYLVLLVVYFQSFMHYFEKFENLDVLCVSRFRTSFNQSIILRVGIFVMQTLCPYCALLCLLITLFRWHIALWLVDIWQECFLGEVGHKIEFTNEIRAEFNSMIWTLCFAVSLTINTMGIRCFDMRTRSFSLMSGVLVFFFCFFLWSVRSYCYTLWKLYKNPNVDCPISCVAC